MSEQVTPKIPSLTLKSDSAVTIRVDALVIATSTDGKFTIVGDLFTKASATKLRSALLAVGATGARDEIVRIPGLGITKSPIIVAIGLGSTKSAPSEEQLRRAAGSATRSLMGIKKIALAIPASTASSAQALFEGAALGAYAFNDHRFATAKKSKAGANSIALLSTHAATPEFRAALSRAKTVVEATTFARNVINTSPLHLPPAGLAAAAKALLTSTDVKVTVLDEKALAKDGYGGILAVGQGSSRPPRLIRMQYSPAGASKHIALVGKGITFDTGGISLKPPASMHEMKADMSGAAAVIATMYAVAALKLPITVTAYAACAENMPGGKAQRPGDVISAYGGRTIEVLNTDAEGRLVMADALVRAAEDKPDAVFDIATLTGASIVALGFRTAGVIGDEEPRNMVLAAAAKAGEEFWPMPMPEELRAPMDSLVADIANIGIREGGMLSAAWFLKDFIAEGLPWAHLDIAGPAFNPQAAHGYTHKGGVGFGVRTLLALLETASSER